MKVIQTGYLLMVALKHHSLKTQKMTIYLFIYLLCKS